MTRTREENAADLAHEENTTYHISGRRWQDTYGNTYHSVQIFQNGGLLHYEPFTYGYNNHYKQTAIEWLNDNGFISKTSPYELRESGINISFSVANVSRKKDL